LQKLAFQIISDRLALCNDSFDDHFLHENVSTPERLARFSKMRYLSDLGPKIIFKYFHLESSTNYFFNSIDSRIRDVVICLEIIDLTLSYRCFSETTDTNRSAG
jgi:hypothetical protein